MSFGPPVGAADVLDAVELLVELREASAIPGTLDARRARAVVLEADESCQCHHRLRPVNYNK